MPQQPETMGPKISLSRGSFSFQSNNTLLISWVIPDEPLPHLPKRKKFSRFPVVPAHLHILLLNAKTGATLREQDLSVPSAPVTLLIGHSGNLIIRAGALVKLYSPDFAILKEVKFPLPTDFLSENSGSNIEISPDGRRIILCSEGGLSTKTAIFDADDLESLGFLAAGQQACPLQLGNGSFRFVTHTGQSSQFIVQNEGTGLQVAAAPGLVHLLNGNALLVIRGNEMAVRAMDGKLLMTDSLPKRHQFWPVAEARDSARFAVETTRMRGLTIPSLDMYAFPSADQLAVYSLKEKRKIFAIKLKGASPWPIDWRVPENECALSPDGSLLAILSNDSVRVYKLP